jgi:hypothetical protein
LQTVGFYDRFRENHQDIPSFHKVNLPQLKALCIPDIGFFVEACGKLSDKSQPELPFEREREGARK